MTRGLPTTQPVPTPRPRSPLPCFPSLGDPRPLWTLGPPSLRDGNGLRTKPFMLRQNRTTNDRTLHHPTSRTTFLCDSRTGRSLFPRFSGTLGTLPSSSKTAPPCPRDLTPTCQSTQRPTLPTKGVSDVVNISLYQRWKLSQVSFPMSLLKRDYFSRPSLTFNLYFGHRYQSQILHWINFTLRVSNLHPPLT